MLQVSYIRENKEKVLERLAVKNFKQPELVDEIISLDEERRQTQSQLDSISAEANGIAKQIGELMRQGKKAEAEELKAKTPVLKEQVKTFGEKLAALEQEQLNKTIQLPNLPHISVPLGNTPEENETIFEHGEKPILTQKLPHWELAAKYDIIDFELGNKITGAGFPVYKGKGAKLQRALINFFLDHAEAAGYSEGQVRAAGSKRVGREPCHNRARSPACPE